MNYDAADLISADKMLIKKSDKVISAGSCFASNLVPYLEKSGLTYHRTEVVHPAFSDNADEELGYAKFSAAYGNIYTVRQLLQLLRRCRGQFSPLESYWIDMGTLIDPYRPGLKHRARSVQEFHALTRQHLQKTLQAFKEATVFVLTLGLTEGWVSKADGAVFPACPGVVSGQYDAQQHEFHNFTVAEVEQDLATFITEIREINPGLKFIVTVSPVSLVATATSSHVLCASTYSKSVLRVAAESAANRFKDVTYFPAYEIVTGPQAPDTFFQGGKRDVTPEAVHAVMNALLAHCEVDGQIKKEAKVAAPVRISEMLVDAECEEVMADR
ncbi:hypothetical protein OV14_0044 [Ensifer adhaerens OV14]|nr:hypothetical protein OV14_0044 [Ensifer adhaerens OV14]